MREVKVESEKMKWPLIIDRSSQKTKQRFVSTWPQIWSKSVEIFVDCSSAPLMTPPRSRQTTFILLIPPIVLAIGTIFGAAFQFKSRDFGGFYDDFNVFDIDFGLDLKSDECDVFNNDFNDCDVSSTINDTSGAGYIQLFNLYPIGAVGNVIDLKSREFSDINYIFNGLNIGLEYDFICDVSSSLAMVTNGLPPPPPHPANNSSPTGAGLSQTSVIDNSHAVSPAPTAAPVIIIIKYESGPSWYYGSFNILC